jgi:hypothetical protein
MFPGLKHFLWHSFPHWKHVLLAVLTRTETSFLGNAPRLKPFPLACAPGLKHAGMFPS